MKKILISILALSCAAAGRAQDSTKIKNSDQVLPRVCADLNYKIGPLTQTLTMLSGNNTAYNNAINTNLSTPKFGKSQINGLDLTIGYFLGKNRRFGIGGGLFYFQSQTELAMKDNFHTEFQSWDNVGGQHRTYRELITSNQPVREGVGNKTVSIPLLAKFKHQFEHSIIGVTADAGGLLSLYSQDKYTTNATFDYEAIYKFQGGQAVYDNAAQPAPNDWLIERSQYADNVTSFNALKSAGYNVDLSKAPKNTSGNHTYAIGYGFLAQAGISFQLNYHLALNVQGYYTFQQLTNNNSTWKMADTVAGGKYTSMVQGAKSNAISSYGLSLGIRMYFGGFPDRDGDGIADAKDKCPYEAGIAEFFGCPDRDGDGVPDKEDRCPTEKGPKLTGGCPDRDDDGVADEVDLCPDMPGSVATGGCPDRDKDGVADDVDLCPDVAGLKVYHGCPTDSTFRQSVTPSPSGPVPTCKPTHIELSRNVINFKTGKFDIESNNYGVLDEVVEGVRKEPTVIIYISGHTDDVGTNQNNLALSFSRAEAVQKYLMSKGIAKSKIFISGMGKTEPVIRNDSPENRAKNRRIEIRLLLPVSY